MAFQLVGRPSFFSVLTAACLLGTMPAGADAAGELCAQAVVKSVAKCVKKAAGTHAKCYKLTGAPCFENDDKIAGAGQGAAKVIRAKCADATEVDAAGYGPLSPNALANNFGDTCVIQGKAVASRTFGHDGSLYANADDDGKKCLLGAAKEAAKYLSAALGVHAKCIGGDCTGEATDAAIAALATATATKIDDKCDDFTSIHGTDAASYVAAATDQVPSAVASPCDPLDTSRCAFPFPSDHFSVPGAGTPSGRQVAIGRDVLPAHRLGRPIVTTGWNRHDGFSVGPMLLMNDPSIDLTMTGAAPLTDLARSLDADAPVVLIDAETGEKQLLWVERDLRGATAADQPIIIRVGRNLKNSHRYIVAMRNMKDSAGNVLSPSAGFALYRDNTPTDILAVELRRPHMEEIFTTLESAGIERDELYLAWDFTTQSEDSTAGSLLEMRDDAFATLGTDAPSFTVTSVTEPLDAQIFRRIDGTFQVPSYILNPNLTQTSRVGSPLRRDAFGTPYADDVVTAKFRCIIPYAATTGGAAPAVPARASLYGHGLLGSHTEVTAGNVRAFASEHNLVFCATDWMGFAGDDLSVVLKVLADFSNFPSFIDRQHQGMLNFLFLGRLMIHAQGFASHSAFQVGGESVIDPSGLFYDGNSQGGILGGVLAAIAQDVTRFSLGVPGMNYSTLLNRSVDFDSFDLLLTDSYPSSADRNLLLSAAQLVWDRTDPSGHVKHVLSDTYENTPPKKILYQVAFGDHQVAPLTVEVAARSNGASIHTPVVDPAKPLPDVTPYYDITPIPAYPFDGSAVVIWDSGNPAPPTGNVPPEAITPSDPEWAVLEACTSDANGDPHSCPRSDPDARIQKSEFLKNNGMVVDVCGGAACKAQ